VQSTGWFKDAIIYHILIDRFAGYKYPEKWNKPVFVGGNIKGITGKLKYLHDLGINTIWISPFYKTSAYHGYHVTDFFSTDPRFGTEKDLKDLIAKAHRSNMRIIADFVPNHCSSKHPFFLESQQNRKSKYNKWFYYLRWPDRYLCFLDFKQLPKLNTANPETFEHITGSARYWLNYGIDGFRLDHAAGCSSEFWKKFVKEIKGSFPESVLIGEIWVKGISFRLLRTIKIRNKYFEWLLGMRQAHIQKEYVGILDGVLDFNFRNRIVEYIAYKEKPEDYSDDLLCSLERYYGKFPADFYLPGFVDNHDMSRFLFECGQDREKLKKALMLQFRLPQPPVIYYGTEAGLSHDSAVMPGEPYSDLKARKPMPWENPDNELAGFCKGLIRERKKQK
jgi:cyclomaltodextrinase